MSPRLQVMGTVLKLVPSVADHAPGAAQAQNTLAWFRTQDRRDPKIPAPETLPCDDCGHAECRKPSLRKEWLVLKAGGAPALVVSMAAEAYLVEVRVCQKRQKLRLVSVFDIETDSQGYCALDNWDHAIDAARERR